ncbi:MAG: hypothetical protein ACEQSR_16505 [Candidatus Methylacidiphilales bacterium]
MSNYKQSEKLLKAKNALTDFYNAKINKNEIEITTKENWFVVYEDVFGEDFKQKKDKIIEAVGLCFQFPSSRLIHKMRGDTLQNAYSKIIGSEVNIDLNTLHLVVHLIEMTLPRLEFKNDTYLPFLIDVLDPISDYINSQNQLVDIKVKEIIDKAKTDYKTEIEDLEKQDIEDWKAANPIKKGLKKV